MSLRTLLSCQSSTHTDPPERRSAPRSTCLREVVCQAVMAGRDESAPALVKDISSTGLRLVLRRCYEPGRALAVSWRYPHGGTQHTLLVHVVHSHNDGSGTWHVGCSMVCQISDKQLAELV
jgi:hypothetical protein